MRYKKIIIPGIILSVISVVVFIGVELIPQNHSNKKQSHSESSSSVENNIASEENKDPNKIYDEDKELFADSNTIGRIWIPRLNELKHPYNFKLYEGVDVKTVFNKGYVGHYPGSANAGDIGNMVLAAHRNTYGEPFRYVNQLNKNDKIIIRTKNMYHVYKLDYLLPQIEPTNLSPLKSIPDEYNNHEDKYITLITCTPEFTSKYRMIWYGHLVKQSIAEQSISKDNLDTIKNIG